MLISCTGINKFYASNHVLRSISLTVENQDRIGLVGDNGCGKSTFLRILTEQELPDAFEHDEPAIAKAPHLRIGYLAQNAGLDGSKTVQEEMTDASHQIGIPRSKIYILDGENAKRSQSGSEYGIRCFKSGRLQKVTGANYDKDNVRRSLILRLPASFRKVTMSCFVTNSYTLPSYPCSLCISLYIRSPKKSMRSDDTGVSRPRIFCF